MNFQDYFWTFRRGFSGLFSGSLGLSSSLVLIKNHVNIYLLDVLTWIAWMEIICKNYNRPWCINVSCSTHICM